MPDTPPRTTAPTNRQVQVLAGIARGLPNEKIAADLGITTAGVHTHVRRLCKRAGTSSRAELVAYGYRTGILAGLTPEPRIVLGLAARHLQILEHMAHGLSNEEIAVRLHLTENSIKSYAKYLYARLQATGRPHAVALGYQHGLIPTTPPAPQRAAA